MMINTRKVKGRMVELGIGQKELAIHLGLSLPTISQKINNKRPVNLSEALELAQMLKIDEGEYKTYFFYS